MGTEPKDLPSKQRIKNLYESYHDYLDIILSRITVELGNILQLSSQPTFKKRVKSFNSYYKKVLRLKPKEASENKSLVCLTDMIGIRVICAFLEDLNLAVQQIREHFEIVEVENKGAEKKFSEFGYESIHVLIKIPNDCLPPDFEQFKDLPELPEDAVCEIQIRTILQDAWAEVEHELIYKQEFTPMDIPLRRKLASLNASLSLADITFQEIRDYQNKLQREIAERRASFYAIADNLTDELSKPVDENQNISRINPFVSGTIDDLILSAIQAHNSGHMEEAIDIYSKIINATPTPDKTVLAVILKHRGMAYFAVNNYEQAIKDFDTSISYDSKAFRTYYYKGIVYSILKDPENAVKSFTESLSLNSFQAHTHFRRAIAYFDMQDYDKAKKDLDDAINLGIDENEIMKFREKLLKKFDMGM